MAEKPGINLSEIKMLVMDVDGVLTDGGIIIHGDGSESKKFNVFDGHRIKMWQRASLECAIISGRETAATAIRAEQLSIKYVMQGCKEKISAFEFLLEQAGLEVGQVVYVGDDLLDLPLVRRAGFGVAVANAINELKEHADYITKLPGGSGAVGEVVEYILKETGKWQGLVERYMV